MITFFLFSETFFTMGTIRVMKIMKRGSRRLGVCKVHII